MWLPGTRNGGIDLADGWRWVSWGRGGLEAMRGGGGGMSFETKMDLNDVCLSRRGNGVWDMV